MVASGFVDNSDTIIMAMAANTKPGIKNGTLVEFIPDTKIFGDYKFNLDFIEKRIWNYAYLNSGLTLSFNGKLFKSENGLLDLLESNVGTSTIYEVCRFKEKQLEFAFSHTNNYGETYYSFVNGQYTSDGGTHLSAFKEGLLKGINEYFRKNYKSEDVREGTCAAVSVKIQAPVFESQTKNKLGNTEVRSWIVNDTKSAVVEWLQKNADSAAKLESKIIANEKLRTELNTVKKEAKYHTKPSKPAPAAQLFAFYTPNAAFLQSQMQIERLHRLPPAYRLRFQKRNHPTEDECRRAFLNSPKNFS